MKYIDGPTRLAGGTTIFKAQTSLCVKLLKVFMILIRQ